MAGKPILLRDTTGDTFEIESRYGPLVPVESLGMWLSR